MSYVLVPPSASADTNGWVHLETKTLTNASTTTFSGLSDKKNYHLVYNVRTGIAAGNQQLAIQINGDTGNNYDYIRFNGAALSAAANTSAYRMQIGNGSTCTGHVVISGASLTDGTTNDFVGISSSCSQWGGGTHECAITGNWDSGNTTAADVTSITFFNDGAGANINGTVSLYYTVVA